MFVLLGELNPVVDIAASHERNKWHHLLDADEGMILVGFAEDEFHTFVDLSTGCLGQDPRILSEQLFGGRMVFMITFTDQVHGGRRQAIDLLAVELDGAGAFHGGHHGIEDRVDDEDFFFSDAEKVVVVSGTLDDAAGSSIEIGGFVDDDRWITWACDDRTFTTIQCRTSYGWSTRYADQSDLAMLEKIVGCIQGGLFDQADQVIDPEFLMDGLIESLDPFGGHLLAAWMRIHDNRVATGDHADRVAVIVGREWGNGSNGADDSERSMFDDRKSMITAEGFGAKELNTRSSLAERLELFDFVLKSADLGLIHFHSAEFDALIDRDLADDLDDTSSMFHRSFAKLFKGDASCLNGVVDVFEQAISTV